MDVVGDVSANCVNVRGGAGNIHNGQGLAARKVNKGFNSTIRWHEMWLS